MMERADTEHPAKRPRLSEKTSHDDRAVNQADGESDQLPESETAVKVTSALDEEANGISDFVSRRLPGFKGILKKRYTDFLVNEILPNGAVVHLRELKISKATRGRKDQAARRNDHDETTTVDPATAANGIESRSEQHETTQKPRDEEENREVKELSSEISLEDEAKLAQYFGEAVAHEIIALYKTVLDSPAVKPTDHEKVKAQFTADRAVRSQIHEAIRQIFHHKIDSSTSSDGTLVLSAAVPDSRKPRNQPHQQSNRNRQGKLGWADRGGEYLHFSLYKENKDTMEIISYLARQVQANPKIFNFAGTKDRRGVTVQKVSAHRLAAERLAGLNKSIRSGAVGDYEYHPHGLELGDLKGNEFVITLRDCAFDNLRDQNFEERVDQAKIIANAALLDLREKGFLNYYGLQRFGTFSTKTSTVGVKLLQEDFEGACNAILAFSPEALTTAQEGDANDKISGDDKARAIAVHLFQTTGKVMEALDKMPRKFSAESNIIRQLGRNPKDYIGALMMIQRNLRLLYVHSHQSLVWNMAVSERWKLYGDKVVQGDLVLVKEHADKVIDGAVQEEVDGDGEIVVQPASHDHSYSADDVFERARALSGEEADSGNYTIFDVVLPQPGYDIIYPANKVEKFYRDFMASEQGGGLDPYHMRRKQKDFSLSGGYRKILSRIEEGYSMEVRSYQDDNEQFVRTDLDEIKMKEQQTHSASDQDANVTSKTQAARRGETSKTETDTEQVVEPKGEMEFSHDAPSADKIAVVLKFQLGSSQYATMALRELSKGGIEAWKPDFGGR